MAFRFSNGESETGVFGKAVVVALPAVEANSLRAPATIVLLPGGGEMSSK